tara:strand:+ start:1252 stop:2001 length:750 start_codon:yes stop_codon:yes gene_type:complete
VSNLHFKIIVPMYNVEEWVETTIKSVKEQTYKDYQCILVDDISTDDTVKVVRKLIKGDKRFKLIVNKEKKYACQNIYEATLKAKPSDEDVIVNLDGDDWLANRNVLRKVSEVYSDKDVLLTYGNHINYPDGEPPWPLFAYPENIVKENRYREFRYLGSHLRTYKYKLWKNLKVEDLQDKDGNFYQMGGDVALMVPLCELAGDRARFISDVLYVYNNKNPNNDYKLDHSLQYSVEQEIRQKAKYNKLELS